MRRILIVDDFEPGRVVLRERLEMQGYACQEVGNGSAALKAMETDRFDLVITPQGKPAEARSESVHFDSPSQRI